MDAHNKHRIIGRYNERLAVHGDDMRSLASGTDERRQIRYGVLAGVGISAGGSVLDVGCGFGTLSEFLHAKQPNIRYTGCDINPKIVEIARAKFPGKEFLVADIQTDALGRRFDYVVSTSSFNNVLEGVDQYQFIEDVLQKAYDIADVGVAFDFMSSYVDFETDQAFHYEPERMLSIAKKISKRICLRHDYPLFEFCIYIYKDFKGWRA